MPENFFDRAARARLSPYQSSVIFILLKHNGLCSIHQLSKETGIARWNVQRSIHSLLKKGLISKHLDFRNSRCFFVLWGASAEMQGGASAEMQGGASAEMQGGASAEMQGGASAEMHLSTKENNNINNRELEEQKFKNFWAEYPGRWIHSVQVRAKEAFLKLSPDHQDGALKAVKDYKQTASVKSGKILSPINFLSQNVSNFQAVKKETPRDTTTEDILKHRQKCLDEHDPNLSIKEQFEKELQKNAQSKPS